MALWEFTQLQKQKGFYIKTMQVGLLKKPTKTRWLTPDRTLLRFEHYYSRNVVHVNVLTCTTMLYILTILTVLTLDMTAVKFILATPIVCDSAQSELGFCQTLIILFQ